ncbi:TetR/AcrR family transcriptional regulator [Symbioplanes lichenis]|uniref:TetR/AcrR family transcriptional regulator n=1 Tax=Symbioplanes lichenis TaxID=1629072 RepID=UPI0027387681|nr:TetR/AcrR family transcriptional regulator [Actinoplanes lichenis]
MSPRREPVSRRTRPTKAPLSREALVSAAMHVMRTEGLERLTMRRLAAELDTGPAAIYVYVRNVAELHGAILDELLVNLELEIDDPWEATLVDLLCSYTELLFDHPSLARSVLTLRPTGLNYLRLTDTLLGLLHAGGVPVARAAWGVDLLLQHATATAAEQGTRSESADAGREDETLQAVLREAPAAGYPNIARARDDLFSGTGQQRLAWAFHALIAGIRTVPTP